MPLALFLISSLVSVSMFVSSSRIVQDSQVNNLLLASSRALYASESSRQLAWNQMRPDRSSGKGVEVVRDFIDKSTALGAETTDGLIVNKRLLHDEIKDISATEREKWDVGERVQSVRTLVQSQADAFVKEYYDSSIDFFFYDLQPGQYFSSFVVDYCSTDVSSCSDLIIEWFEIQRVGFSVEFDSLEQLKDDPFADPYQSSKIGRKVVNSADSVQRGQYANLNFSSSADPEYKKRFTLSSFVFVNNHYLVRFRSQDGKPFHFQVQVHNTTSKPMKIPNTIFEVDDVSSSDDSFRRVRQQKRFSSGLQPGLEYLMAVDRIIDK